MNIVALSGSLQKKSSHTALLKQAEKLLPQGSTLIFASVDLPLYNEDIDNTVDPSHATPESVLQFKQLIDEADALLIASPEYNHSVSGPLKNALDWASRPGFESPLKHKPIAIMSASPSPVGGARGQAHLRSILASTLSEVYPAIEYIVGSSHQAFNADNELIDDTAQRRLKKFISGFIQWADSKN